MRNIREKRKETYTDYKKQKQYENLLPPLPPDGAIGHTADTSKAVP